MSLKIQDFIKQYDNYPILFVGAGLSLRYLEILILGMSD